MSIKSFKPKVGQQVQTNKTEEQLPRPPEVQGSYVPKPQSEQQEQRSGFKLPAMPKFEFKGGSDVVRMIPLGGVGDVTKNMYVYEYKDDIVIVDCGVSFPEEGMLGVDLVIPDITYLRDKKHKIRGIVITHGHDDHYGALPYIWPELDVPIYSQKLTCGLIKGKFTDHNLPKDKIKTLAIDDTIKLGAFNISFYQVSHSVPDSTGVVLETPVGTLIHQADFKVDWTPVNGQVPDVGRIAELGKKGVAFMTIDCLRVEKKGYTLSEKTIEPTFEAIEKETKGKLLITTITSNISRIQQAVNVAARAGRKVAFAGRSMENNVQISRDLGYLDIPAGLLIAQEEVKRFADNKLMIIIAGSLGQTGSALSRVANGDHKYIRLGKDDIVVFSSDPMPSAEFSQGKLLDQISRFGCKVYYSALDSDLHVSGHAAREEIKLMINLAKPKSLFPMGGTFKHIRAFGEMAYDLGYKEGSVLMPTEVEIIEVSKEGAKLTGQRLPYSNVYVDGLGVGDVGSIILNDRQVMSEEGVVVVVVPLEKGSGRFVGEVSVISRGFVFGEAEEDLTGAAKEIIKSILSEQKEAKVDVRYIKEQVERHLEKFFYEETKRRPLILTQVMEV